MSRPSLVAALALTAAACVAPPDPAISDAGVTAHPLLASPYPEITWGAVVAVNNLHSAYCMDVAGASLVAGAHVQQYGCHYNANQLWRFEPEAGTSGPWFELVNVNSGDCLTVEPGPGTRWLTQRPCQPFDHTQHFAYLASTINYYGELINRDSKLCVDVPGFATGAAWLQGYPCNGGSNQLWTNHPKPGAPVPDARAP